MSVRVVARIRPLLETELDKDIIVRPDGGEAGKPHTIVKIPSPKNPAEEFSFAFNAVYDESTSQETLFTSEGTVYKKKTAQLGSALLQTPSTRPRSLEPPLLKP